MQLGVEALARQNWSANACASADYGEADVIVSAKAVRRAAHGTLAQSVLLACIPSVLQAAGSKYDTPRESVYAPASPKHTRKRWSGEGLHRVWRVKPPRGQGRRTPSPRAFRAEWEDYKPARASGTRDDDDEAPTRQKELLKKNYYYRSLFVRSSGDDTNLKRAVG